MVFPSEAQGRKFTVAGMLDREQTPSLQTIDEQKVLISY